MNFNGQGKMQNTIKPHMSQIEILLDELADFVGSHTNEGFYRKVIRILGPGRAREGMREVSYRVLSGNPSADPIKDKARYLTGLYMRWMEEHDLYTSPPAPAALDQQLVLGQNPSTDLCANPGSIPDTGKEEIQSLDFPFSPDLIQWLNVIGPEYFTLTNDIMKSDCVPSTRLEIKGRVYEVPMLRGKKSRADVEERGILTSEHMRVLGAVERIWADNRGPHERIGRRCVVRTTAADIARYMGIKPDGHGYKRIASKLNDLGGTGYCYLLKDHPELKAMSLDDLSFQFFGEVKSLTTSFQGRKTEHFHITFSSDYSAALLARDKNIVSRPLDMITIRGDIALKLYIYLYPILTVKKEFSIEVGQVKEGGVKTGLLKALGLKTAGWMRFKSQRKREFEKAINEINGRVNHKGEVFHLSIEQGLNDKDYLLVARLIDAEGKP